MGLGPSRDRVVPVKVRADTVLLTPIYIYGRWSGIGLGRGCQQLFTSDYWPDAEGTVTNHFRPADLGQWFIVGGQSIYTVLPYDSITMYIGSACGSI